MIHYVKGDILMAQSEAIVNTVNTVGVMGKGVALHFKEAYPGNFRAYAEATKAGEVKTGKMFVYRAGGVNGVRFIINFPTKEQWFAPSKYEWIEAGLKDLVQVIKAENIKSIALPPLGCGNGRLKWERVRPMIESALGEIAGLEVLVYEPSEKIKELLESQDRREVNLTPARGMLLHMLFMYEQNGERACLFAANKLAYFLQRFGEKQLKLRFENHHYGPYSNQVDQVMYRLQGSWLSGYEEKQAGPFEPLQLRYDRYGALDAYVKGLSDEEKGRMASLEKFLQGFESPLSLEVLATVDRILEANPDADLHKILVKIGDWSERKKQLIREHHVKVAMEHLTSWAKQLYQG